MGNEWGGEEGANCETLNCVTYIHIFFVVSLSIIASAKPVKIPSFEIEEFFW